MASPALKQFITSFDDLTEDHAETLHAATFSTPKFVQAARREGLEAVLGDGPGGYLYEELQKREHGNSSSLAATIDSVVGERLQEYTDTMRNIVSEQLQEHTAQLSKQEQSISFSSAPAEAADELLRKLSLKLVDGNSWYPIEMEGSNVECDNFKWADFATEDEGTPALMRHHQQQLEKFGVRFGRDAFQVYDLHKFKKLYSIVAPKGPHYKGSVDGCVAPFGLFASSAANSAFIIYEHKHHQGDEQQYREQKNLPQVQGSRPFTLDAHKGQCVLAVLGACTVNDFPALLDLTDGEKHNLLSVSQHDGEVVVWQDLDPTRAYFKQAELLGNVTRVMSQNNTVPRVYQLDDIPEELQRPVKKLRDSQPQSALSEQLETAMCHLAPADRRVCAYEIIDSWLSSQLPPPMSSSSMQMYS